MVEPRSLRLVHGTVVMERTCDDLRESGLDDDVSPDVLVDSCESKVIRFESLLEPAGSGKAGKGCLAR